LAVYIIVSMMHGHKNIKINVPSLIIHVFGIRITKSESPLIF